MHKLFVCGALAALVALASSYHFQDSFYNQIIARDLEELQASLDEPQVHSRPRRDEEAANPDKCRKRRFKACCVEDLLEAVHDKDKELKKECFKDVTGKNKDARVFDPFKCERMEKHKKEMICVAQCVGQKKNVLDADGNVVDEEFRKSYKDNFGKETWLAPKLDALVDKCLSLDKNATQEKSDPDDCNPAAIKLGHCMFKEIQLVCPADKIKDQKSCNRFLERAKGKEDFMMPMRPPMMEDE